MDSHYQIEELVSQDTRGVMFQGVDSVTGIVVAMRRFISSQTAEMAGMGAGALAFQDAIELMRGMSHPSLRRVLAGGCDSVDGMPYLVTHWVDGPRLRDVVNRDGPFTPESAMPILSQLLNLNAMMSKSLGRDGLWAEAMLESVQLKPTGDDEAASTAVFWISPWRWLGDGAAAAGAFELADFAQALLGGPRVLANQYGDSNIATWIRDIRNKKLTSLGEIRDALSAPGTIVSPFVLGAQKNPSGVQAAGAPGRSRASQANPTAVPVVVAAPLAKPEPAAEVPVVKVAPVARMAAGAKEPPAAALKPAPLPPAPAPRGRMPAALLACAALIAAIGGLGWMWFAKIGAPEVALQPTAAAPAVDPDLDVSVPRGQRQSRLDEMMGDISREQETAQEVRREVERRGYFTIDDAGLMLDHVGQISSLRGKLARIRFSASGLTMYLEFSENTPLEEPRAFAMARDLVEGIRPEDLEDLIGKSIEIRGGVEIENVASTRRPRIRLLDRGQIRILDDTAAAGF